MNNFTKEELSLLLTCLTKQLSNVHYPLEDKITSMINNYCEHTNYEKLYTSCGGVENFGCKDCNCQFINEPISYKKTIVGKRYDNQ